MLCSCSKDDSNDISYKSYDITGIYEVIETVNCNIDHNEFFVLFNTKDECDLKFNLDSLHKDARNIGIGEFYALYKTETGRYQYPRFNIVKYNINEDILTLYIRNINYKTNSYEYKFEFKINEYTYHKSLCLTCINSTFVNEMLILNEGSVIKLEYLGDDIYEAFMTEYNKGKFNNYYK